jgi:hypothetical protein
MTCGVCAPRYAQASFNLIEIPDDALLTDSTNTVAAWRPQPVTCPPSIVDIVGEIWDLPILPMVLPTLGAVREGCGCRIGWRNRARDRGANRSRIGVLVMVHHLDDVHREEHHPSAQNHGRDYQRPWP